MASSDLSLVELPGSAASDDETAASLAAMRGEARLMTWTRDGTLLEAAKFADAWGIDPDALDHARARTEIFALWIDGKYWYPAEAIRLGKSVAALINHSLGDIDPSSKLLFLLRPHGALRGHTAVEAIARGQLDEVLRLADDWARS